MMDFLTPTFIIGIITLGIYGLFELFVRKKERLAIIEKIGDKLGAPEFNNKLSLPNYKMPRISFSALKGGCLMMGVGLGLLIAFAICLNLPENAGMFSNSRWHRSDAIGTVYVASMLLFGGLSLLIAFLLELNISKKKDKENK